jgi:sugar/nucleoside kinase (ribokinase family)
MLGANPAYTLDDVDWDAVAASDHLHLGGPELIGADNAARILSHAKENGVTTSIDLIAPGAMGSPEAIAGVLPHTDYVLPNEDQVIGFTRAANVADGCQAMIDAGAGMVVATLGPAGALVFDESGGQQVPAYHVTVVDTTGCGDAFSAGFLYAVMLGRTPVQTAQLGSAVAALLAQGLGSDHGDFDLDAADAFAARAQRGERAG